MFESPMYDESCNTELSMHEPTPPMHNSAQPSRVLYSAGSEPVDPRARSLTNALSHAEGGIVIDDYIDEDDPFFCNDNGDEQGKNYHFMPQSV